MSSPEPAPPANGAATLARHCRASKPRLALGILLVGALALRIAHVLALRGDVLFDHPMLDEGAYVQDALGILRGQPPQLPFWHPPGLAYAMAAIFGIAGPSLLILRCLQALLATLCVALTYGLGRRLFSVRVGLVAAALAAGHGVLVFEAGELLPATWIMVFSTLGLYLLVVALDRQDWRWSGLCGATFGIAAQFSPLVLVFMPLAGLAAWAAAAGRRRLWVLAALVLGTASTLAPTALYNYQKTGDVVLVSTNGGLNFYLGNNENYLRTFALRPGMAWDELTLEPRRAGIPDLADRSRYFYKKGLAYIETWPAYAAWNFAYKLYGAVHGAEIPRDADLYAFRAQSPVLRVLVWPRPFYFPNALLMPMAVAGGVACLARRRQGRVAAWFFLSQIVVLAVFFSSSRHRAPLLPVACLLAVVAAREIWHLLRSRSHKGLALAGTATVAVLGMSVFVPAEANLQFPGELDFYRGIAWMQHRKDPSTAVKALGAAIAANPGDARYWRVLGMAQQQLGTEDEAMASWMKSAELDPVDLWPRRAMSSALAQRGDYAGAQAQLEANLKVPVPWPGALAEDHFQLAQLRVGLRAHRAVADHLREVLRLDPTLWRLKVPPLARDMMAAQVGRDAHLWLVIGDLFRQDGDEAMARQSWTHAARWTPDPATSAELARRSQGL